jgi:AraC-like DNA-binding protein
MAFTGFLRSAGVPVDRHLRRHGLPVLCEEPDAFVPLQRVWSFFDSVARQEDLTLGWRAGASAGDHNLNVGLLRKLESAPTLYQAIQRLVRLVSAEASHLQIGMLGRKNDVLLYTHYAGMRETPGYMVSQAYQLEIFLDLIRHFLGRHWVPHEIGIESRHVPNVVEQQLPGTRILTQQAVGYIAVPRACLYHSPGYAEPNMGAADDPVLSENFEYLDTLRAVLRSYLPDGYPSAQFAATLMDVSERTLARRLSACDLTYGTLVDELRFAEAKKLLEKPGPRIGDVAMAVGFEDQSNFTRMFRRVGGLSPKEFRKATLH